MLKTYWFKTCQANKFRRVVRRTGSAVDNAIPLRLGKYQSTWRTKLENVDGIATSGQENTGREAVLKAGQEQSLQCNEAS